MIQKAFFIPLVALCVWLAAAPATLAQDREKPRVVATIAQIAEPLGHIVADSAKVISLMGPGVDPHLYRPTRSDIMALSRADLILWTGQTLESKMANAIRRLGQRSRHVPLVEKIPPARLLQDAENERDPHLWMDAGLWQTALKAAVDALAETVAEEKAEAVRARARTYFQKLEALDRYVAQLMTTIPEKRRVLITAHDAFNYYGRAYGIRVEGVQGTSTETEAGLKDVERLVRLIVERDIPAVFAETSVSDRNIRALIEGAAAKDHRVAMGGRLYSDAMGKPDTYKGTYIGMIEHNATTIARALGGTVSPGGFKAYNGP